MEVSNNETNIGLSNIFFETKYYENNLIFLMKILDKP